MRSPSHVFRDSPIKGHPHKDVTTRLFRHWELFTPEIPQKTCTAAQTDLLLLSPISQIYLYIQSYVFGLGQSRGNRSDA